MSNKHVNDFAAVRDFIGRFGHQILITSAGVSMTAQFASSHDILWWPVAWAMAIGFEWSWLRGLMQAGETRSKWVDHMVKAGATSVVTFGVLWCLIAYHVIPETPGVEWGVALSLAHVLPIVFMAYCSAQIHREIEVERVARERKEQEEQRQEEREQRAAERALQLQKQEKEQELELWEKAQLVKQRLKGSAALARPATYPAPHKVYECPQCGSEITAAEYGNYKSAQTRGVRWRGCKACREQARPQTLSSGSH